MPFTRDDLEEGIEWLLEYVSTRQVWVLGTERQAWRQPNSMPLALRSLVSLWSPWIRSMKCQDKTPTDRMRPVLLQHILDARLVSMLRHLCPCSY